MRGRFRTVESARLWGETAGELRGAMDAVGLRGQSAHMDLARLDGDAPAAFAEAKALGGEWVVCPWGEPGKPFRNA